MSFLFRNSISLWNRVDLAIIVRICEFFFKVAFFNNYLQDPKRPSLPEHPGNKSSTNHSQSPQGQQYSNSGAYGGPPQGMMGYSSMRGGPSHHMMRGGYAGKYFHYILLS